MENYDERTSDQLGFLFKTPPNLRKCYTEPNKF